MLSAYPRPRKQLVFESKPPILYLIRRPVVSGTWWGPAGINVADQRHDDESLLNWMERLIRRRRETPEIGLGAFRVVPVPEAPIFALRYDWQNRTVLVVHNLGRLPRRAALELEAAADWHSLVDLFGCGDRSLHDGRVAIALDSATAAVGCACVAGKRRCCCNCVSPS